MAEGTIIRANAPKDAATFTLKVNGDAVPGTVKISAITVFVGVGRIGNARIEIFDGDPAEVDFKASASDHFVPGNELEVMAGYRSDETLIFRGIITSQKLSIRSPGASLLTVSARHPAFKATLERRSRVFSDLSDDEAISQILSEHEVNVEASASGLPTNERLVQWMSTDWDFALARAEANGLLLIPTLDGAELKAPAPSGAAALSLLFGATILELDAEMDARTQPAEANGLAWNPASQAAIDSTGSEPNLPSAGNLDAVALSDAHAQKLRVAHPGAVPQEELDAFVAGRLLHRRLARIHGRARCAGTADPVPGALLELGGLGARFNGTHLISAVRHVVKRGTWQTDIQFGLPPKSLLENEEITVMQPPAAGMLPSVQGLAIGVVTAIHEDPASEVRVQISIPALGEEASPIWARLTKFDAGNGRGSFFYPEVGDEVTVGFLNDDPRHPVVLGSLYSSSNTPPLTPSEENHEKGYFSREGLKFVFNDEKKSILLETPNGNLLELSDDTGGIKLEDENGNKIVMDSSGITVESATALQLKAATDAKVEGGANVELAASAQLKVAGSGGAELSASGNVTIKGAMVQIN